MARIESGSEQTLTPAGEGYPVIISATAPTKTRFPALIVGQLWLDTTVPQLKRCTNADTPTYTSAEYTHPNHSGDVTSVADGAQTIAAAAVTLAMMASLEQDKFIGRTTASTGVPETATITAAARTVLDDTTVAAMVDTLGGAAATGTGGLARASAPTFSGNPTISAATPSILFRAADVDSEDIQQDASSNLNLVNNTSGYGTLVRVTRLGNLTLGAAAVGTSGGRVLGLGNGVEPTTSPADLVQLYAVDIAGGDATLGLRTEKAVVTPAGDFALTTKLIVRVNGTTYAIGMTTVLT